MCVARYRRPILERTAVSRPVNASIEGRQLDGRGVGLTRQTGDLEELKNMLDLSRKAYEAALDLERNR
jgi:hypothetical protein